MQVTPQKTVVGHSLPRKEAFSKLTGAAQYVDDISRPNMLYGVTIRSKVARATIKDIQYLPGVPWDEFVVVTARDLPGPNVVKFILEDQPVLAEKEIHHADEPVVLIAHRDRYLVQKARNLVQIVVEEKEPLFDIEVSARKERIIWGQDNTFKEIHINKGDVDSAWASADLIVEGTYHTGASEQLYIENNGMIAEPAPDGKGITVWGSLQCPYYVHPALVFATGFEPERVRVIQMETGGGFGGKEEYPNVLACHVAALALKAKQPVKMIYDREEDLAATTKRHPSRTTHRTAVSKEGKLLAMDIDFLLDGGAYATLSSVVLSRGTIHAAGPYFCPHVRICGRAVATNYPPHGAYRGFGNPQSMFALERHLNKVAAAVGLSPEEFRKRNYLSDGLTTATGQVIRDGVDIQALVDETFAKAGYYEKLEQFAQSNPSSPVKKGMGFAVFYHGSGFTGSGETRYQAIAGVEATADGRVKILSGSTEIGQGTNTIFSQIAAEALQLPYENFEVVRPDTDFVPNSGPTVASRTCMVVGKLVETASIGLKQALVQSAGLKTPYTPEEFQAACQRYLSRYPDLKIYSQYFTPPNIRWNEQTFQGDAYAAFGWAVYVAEVSVDTRTYEVQVKDFVAMQEIGKVVNPVLAEGQVEGGVAQGIGFAISEKIVYDKGRVINNQMTNYIMPTAVDLPSIRVLFHEAPYGGGPKGAKGVGELPLNGPGPAIINAIENAIGVGLDFIPATPEDIFRACAQQGAAV